MNQLSGDFLLELFKLCFRRKEILEICARDLNYSFLPSDVYKRFWKAIYNYWRANSKIPTIGIIAQQFSTDKEVTELLSKIKDIAIPPLDEVVVSLEEFIKQAKFQVLYDSIADVYNDGKKEEAYTNLYEGSQDIINFSIKKQSYYEEVFSGFEKRFKDRKVNKELGHDLQVKVPLSIDEIDYYLGGGIREGDTVLALAQSGVGKTKFLRWVGVGAARRGFKVLHVQAEGSKDECLEGFDSTWTGLINEDIENSEIDKETIIRLKRVIRDIQVKGGEIFVHAYEQFNSASLLDVRQLIIDVEKIYGHIDLICLDYFELFDPGDGKRYSIDHERERRRQVGKGLKNIALEFKTRVVTCTQASNVPLKLLEDPEFILTRENVSEFKNIVEPFSLFLTFNQTSDEKKNDRMRVYIDKIRKHKSGRINRLIKIYQSYKNDRFYDRKRTIDEFFTPNEQ